MKEYHNIKSLNKDLHILNLERQIAWEEIKSVKEEYKEDLKPLNWVPTILKFASKMGVMVLLKRFTK